MERNENERDFKNKENKITPTLKKGTKEQPT